jgi:hypothetical protein
MWWCSGYIAAISVNSGGYEDLYIVINDNNEDSEILLERIQVKSVSFIVSKLNYALQVSYCDTQVSVVCHLSSVVNILKDVSSYIPIPIVITLYRNKCKCCHNAVIEKLRAKKRSLQIPHQIIPTDSSCSIQFKYYCIFSGCFVNRFLHNFTYRIHCLWAREGPDI